MKSNSPSIWLVLMGLTALASLVLLLKLPSRLFPAPTASSSGGQTHQLEYSPANVLNHLKGQAANAEACSVRSLTAAVQAVNSSSNLTASSSPSSKPLTHRVDLVLTPEPASFCQTSEANVMRIYLFILSQFDHTYHREIIRSTWASRLHYKGVKVSVVFVIGRPPSNQGLNITREQLELEEESQRHGDMLQVNAEDTYVDLILKHLAALHHQQTCIPSAEWVIKADEDIFLHLPALVHYFKTLASNETLNNDEHRMLSQQNKTHDTLGKRKNEDIICPWLDSNNPKPHRDGKWKVTVDEYPFEKFPSFCHGQMYAYRGWVAESMWQVVDQLPCHLWLEDVYMSGVVAGAVGAKISTEEAKKWKDIPKYTARKSEVDHNTSSTSLQLPVLDWVESGRHLRALIEANDITKYRRQLRGMWDEVQRSNLTW